MLVSRELVGHLREALQSSIEPKCPCGTAYLRVEGGYVPVCACAAKNSVPVEPPAPLAPTPWGDGTAPPIFIGSGVVTLRNVTFHHEPWGDGTERPRHPGSTCIYDEATRLCVVCGAAQPVTGDDNG